LVIFEKVKNLVALWLQPPINNIPLKNENGENLNEIVIMKNKDALSEIQKILLVQGFV
jgi:hypothetical protein